MTNREHNDLEKLLKDNLSDKTALVPDFVWDKIEEELFPKKKRRGFFWLFFGGIALIGCFVAAYFAFGNDKHIASQTASIQHENRTVSSGKKQTSQVESKIPGKNISNEKARIQDGNSRASNENGAENFAGILKSGEKNSAVKERVFPRHTKKNTSFKTTAANGNKSGLAEKTLVYTDPKLTGNPFSGSGNLEKTGEKIPENKVPLDALAEKIPVQDSTLADHDKLQKVPDAKDSDSNLPEIVSGGNEITDTLKPQEKSRRFAISVYGGTSLYDMAVFKDYFTSGQLSNRSFKSSGFELGAGFGFKVSRKIGIYTNVAFNQKNTSFDYNLAITESDYFDHLLNGELLPLENIIDNGVGNCFLTNVKADYKVTSLLVSLGSTFEIMQLKKFSIGADLRFSSNLNSGLTMNELTTLKIAETDPEHFNALKIGAGLNLDYHFSNKMSLGITPMYHLQFNGKQSFYSKKLKELVLPLSFKFYF